MARATGFLFWVMASLLVRAGARVWRDDGTAPGPRGIVPAGCFRATFRPLWRCSKSVARASTAHPGPGRSEEHTSELQSLLRISYAVFCLQKKNNTNTPVSQTHKTQTIPIRTTF